MVARGHWLIAVRKGATMVHACSFLGVSRTTTYDWLARGRSADAAASGSTCPECGGSGLAGSGSAPCLPCWGSGWAHEYRSFAVGYELQAGQFLARVEMDLAEHVKTDHRAAVWILRNRAPDAWPGMQAPPVPNEAAEGSRAVAELEAARLRAEVRRAEAEAETAEAKRDIALKVGARGLLLLGIRELLDSPDLPVEVRDGLEEWLTGREVATIEVRDLTAAEEDRDG